MNAYLLELLTYLFRLCFNQCNASLHFGSSKHSCNFENPPSLSFCSGLYSYLIPWNFLLFQLLLLFRSRSIFSPPELKVRVSCSISELMMLMFGLPVQKLSPLVCIRPANFLFPSRLQTQLWSFQPVAFDPSASFASDRCFTSKSASDNVDRSLEASWALCFHYYPRSIMSYFLMRFCFAFHFQRLLQFSWALDSTWSLQPFFLMMDVYVPSNISQKGFFRPWVFGYHRPIGLRCFDVKQTHQLSGNGKQGDVRWATEWFTAFRNYVFSKGIICLV